MSRKASTEGINPEQFREDYRALPQSELMRKYNITSTTLMKLIRQMVPPGERYSVRMRNGLSTSVVDERTADAAN